MRLSEPTLAAAPKSRQQEHAMYLPPIDGDDGASPPPRPVWVPKPEHFTDASEDGGEAPTPDLEFLECDCPDDCPRDHPNE
jgi:hypothetical protein